MATKALIQNGSRLHCATARAREKSGGIGGLLALPYHHCADSAALGGRLGGGVLATAASTQFR